MVSFLSLGKLDTSILGALVTAVKLGSRNCSSAFDPPSACGNRCSGEDRPDSQHDQPQLAMAWGASCIRCGA